MTHKCRSKGQTGVEVFIKENFKLSTTKDSFLINASNKQKFIEMLSQALEEAGCSVHKAEGDADLLMCLKAMESSKTMSTVLVGDDTDLLILLLYQNQVNCTGWR